MNKLTILFISVLTVFFTSSCGDDDILESCSGTVDICGICNGPGETIWYEDADGDGLGNPDLSVNECNQPNGFVNNSNDEDDTCNGIIDNCGICNGPGETTWYEDADGDGLGNPDLSVNECNQPNGFVNNSNDDDDTCNGTVDICGICNGPGETIWYEDADGDGLGNPDFFQSSCLQPNGFVENNDDDDNDGNPNHLVLGGVEYTFNRARLIRPADLVDGSPLYPYRIAFFTNIADGNPASIVVSFNIHPEGTTPTDADITVGEFNSCICPSSAQTGLKSMALSFQTPNPDTTTGDFPLTNESTGSLIIEGSGRNLKLVSSGLELANGTSIELNYVGFFED